MKSLWEFIRINNITMTVENIWIDNQKCYLFTFRHFDKQFERIYYPELIASVGEKIITSHLISELEYFLSLE